MAVREVPFTEVLSNVVDNRGRTCPTIDSGMPLIATNCVRNDLLYPAYEKVRYVSEDTYANWFRGHPEPGDLIFVCKGTPGRVCVTPDPVGFCIAQDMVAVRADPTKIYPRFLFAALRSDLVQQRIANMHVGTLIPHFKKGDFDKLFVPLPDYGTQVGIGNLYFTLSAKIDLNRRMNATLEGISRAIFKSWFVDFDPVRQKAAGQQPVGMDAQTAALFPDSFEDAEIGEVPKGWRVGRLDDAVVLQRGFDLPASARTDGKHPVMAAGGLNGFHKEYMVRGPGVTTGRSGVLGRVYFVHEDFWPLNTSLWVKEYRASSPLHAYHMLTRIDFSVFNAGSAVPTLNRNHVHGLPVILAGSDVVHAFDAVIGPMFKANRLRETESHTLAALRDTLLSKLLSGEIRVPEAEEVAAST